MTVDPSLLDSPSLSHVSDYLDWAPAAHHDDCSETGWQVRTYDERQFVDSPTSIGLRAHCPTCGVSYELAVRTGFRDEHGDSYGPHLRQETFQHRGYQTKPKKVLSFWLHAGGRRLDGMISKKQADSFDRYYVTDSKQPPFLHSQVLGTIGWSVGRRGGTRWTAALVKAERVGESTFLEPVDVAETPFTSPIAAARWIARSLADQPLVDPS